MTRRRLPAHEIRRDAYRLALAAAYQRELAGDPEGAGAIRDLARDIRRLRLTEDAD